MSGKYRVGIDIGGTFTDFVLLDQSTGALVLHKRLTTPSDPADGALLGLEELLTRQQLALNDVQAIVHGTTLVTNAIIERKGARTALLATKGFRDVLEMGREQRYDIYDLFLEFPEPYVPRKWRVEVDERVSRDGVALRSPNLQEVTELVGQLIAEGVEALAISFLHAYRNPLHEREVAAAVRRAFPELAVSVSSEVIPEIREYERTSTTVCNAYVQPLVDRYLRRLETELTMQGFRGQLLLMQSSGGTASTDTARRFPVRLLESGPAGGAMMTAFLGRMVSQENLLGFDMGGTTAKACLICDGRPDVTTVMEAARIHRFKRGSGVPIKAPVVDMIEIGAGGGSIARVDSLGLLKVGPKSSGADPGPACYGLGGTEPTVTDACLVLGYFDPDYFLGGAMRLDVAASERALELVGLPLGLDVTATAWGIYSIVCESMAQAARVHIIEKGHDPRRHPLVAFGGAGPAHAVRVAKHLGVSEVIVPRLSGVASALGFLLAPISFEFSRSLPGELRDLEWEVVASLYQEMEAQARKELATAGVQDAEIYFERWADMRLSGQFHEIEVALPNGVLGPETREILAKAFHDAYRQLYHVELKDYEPMVLNWHLRAAGAAPDVQFGYAPAENEVAAGTESGVVTPVAKGQRRAYFPESGGYLVVPVYDRHRLTPGTHLEGPAIVEEPESTTLIGLGDVLHVDSVGNLRIKVVART